MYFSLAAFYPPNIFLSICLSDLVAQSVARLTAHPGVTSSIPGWSHTFMVIDHEMIYMVILLPPIQEGLVSVTS